MDHYLSVIPTGPSTWLFLGATALLAACSPKPPQTDGTPRATSIDLLARKPDLRIEQAGQLQLHPTDHWQGSALGGWYAKTLPAQEGLPAAAMMSQPSAFLLLTSTFPSDRDLKLSAWTPEGDPASPLTLGVYLNGVAIAEELTLSNSPQEYVVAAPGAAWLLGENVLELRAPTFTPKKGGGPTFDAVRISDVAWGPALLIEKEEQALVLCPGTGLRYDLEPLGNPRLKIRGRASAEGELELHYKLVDPSTGKLESLGIPPYVTPLTAGIVELDLPTPKRGEKILRLELVWRSSNAAANLRLEDLRLHGGDAAPRPPIIFISIDTFSARHMAVYGYNRQTTPQLEALLDEAVLFERCVANAPWTTPSYLSVLSGLFPRAHQIDPDGPGSASLFDQWQMAENRWTLAESMRARGYETAGFVDTIWLNKRFRVDQGFDLWDDTAAGLPSTHPAYGVAYVTETAERWLADLAQDRTPFLFLHALDAHGPYLPELPYLGTFQHDLPEPPHMVWSGADYQAAGAMPDWMSKTSLHGIDMLTPEQLRDGEVPRDIAVGPIIARYDEALLKIDAYVGSFLDAIRAQGVWDEAVIIVTGDHGEAFEDEYYGHARLYQDVLEVPLIIKLPKGRGAGKRIATGVQLVDIYPTLMELTSNTKAASWLHGRSLLPLIDAGGGPTEALFSEGGHFEAYTVIVDQWKLIESYPSRESGAAALITHPLVPRSFLEKEFPELIGEPLTADLMRSIEARPGFEQRVRDLRKLLAASEPFHHLFDLDKDPRETENLAAANPERVRELQGQLDALKSKSRAGQATAVIGISMEDLSPEQLEELSHLGYGPPLKEDEEESNR